MSSLLDVPSELASASIIYKKKNAVNYQTLFGINNFGINASVPMSIPENVPVDGISDIVID